MHATALPNWLCTIFGKLNIFIPQNSAALLYPAAPLHQIGTAWLIQISLRKSMVDTSRRCLSRAIETNEVSQRLHHILTQFMKCWTQKRLERFLYGVSQSRRDFCPDGKNTNLSGTQLGRRQPVPQGFLPGWQKHQRVGNEVWTVSAGPAGIFARMAKTKKPALSRFKWRTREDSNLRPLGS